MNLPTAENLDPSRDILREHRRSQESRILKLRRKEDLRESFRLRYSILVEKMHRDKMYADHNERILSDRFDSGSSHFGLFKGGRLVASSRMTFGTARELPDPDLYQYSHYASPEEKIALVSKFCLDEEYRSSAIFLRMSQVLLAHGIEEGAAICFIATNDGLVPLFRRLGFVETGNRHESWEDYGTSNPMYLRRATAVSHDENSPFAEKRFQKARTVLKGIES